MVLTKTYGQYKKGVGPSIPESYLDVMVEYDPQSREVKEVISVSSFNCDARKFTDLTAIFEEQLSNQLDEILDSIDWHEIYTESRREALVG